MAQDIKYTVFQGRAGDHNDLAIPGAQAVGEAFAERTGVTPFVVGTPAPSLNVGWKEELDAARHDLQQMQTRFEDVMSKGAVSIAATSRCAVSLATLPIIAKHHPQVCILWFDAHADLNIPTATTTGYLGGMALAAPLGIWDSGLGMGLKPDQIVLVGQRDLDPFEQDLIDREGIRHIRPGGDLTNDLRNAIGDRSTYVHLDCDVLEPGIVPTDYVLEGGLSLDDLHACSKVIAAQRVIGLEIAEFQNAWEPGGVSVSPAALIESLQPFFNADRRAD